MCFKGLIGLSVYVLAVCSTIVSATSFADGGGSSNGGNSIVCRNSNNEITSTELLDLYEGRTSPIRKLQPLERNLSAAQLTQAWAKRLTEVVPYVFDENFRKEVQTLTQSFTEYLNTGAQLNEQIVFSKETLQGVQDSRHIFVPRGCSIVQTVLRSEKTNPFLGNAEYYVDAEMLARVSPLNLAALIMHEAIYKVFDEKFGDSDSIRSRALVALMFSQTEQAFDFLDYF